MTERPVLSVIVPTFNRADALGLILEHLAQQTLAPDRFEVIVVDDGSEDATVQIVTSDSYPSELICLQQPNRGAAAARNLGARHARAGLLLFLDADVVPHARLLAAHRQAQARGERCLVVGRVRPWPATPRPWYERTLDPESTGMDYGDREQALPFYMLLGGNFSIARGAFEEIGGYDEAFPAAGCEETEFAYRAGLLGYELCYQPGAIGYHNHPRSLDQRSCQQAAHMRSMALFIAKHPELQTVIPGADDLMPLWAAPRSPGSLLRRARASLYASRPVRLLFYHSLSLLDRLERGPRLASFLFWRLMLGWRQAGFRQGLRRYGPAPGSGGHRS